MEKLIISISRTFYATAPSKEELTTIIKVLGDNKLSLNPVWLLIKPTTWTQPAVDAGRDVPMVMSVEVQRKRVGGEATGGGS